MATNAIVEVKRALNAEEIKTRFGEILGAKAPQFMASITNAVTGNKYLQNCSTQSIMASAFVAASLDLPIDPNLGRAYIIPYGDKAQFQIGYKGFVELAIRTGKYKDMNAVEIYEDELKEYNPVLGKLTFATDFSQCKQREAGETDKIVGYYAYYELLTGFAKGLYMTKQQVINHAERYSQAYKNKKKDSPWFINFDEMAKKTVLKRLLSKWGILSVEMQKAVAEDQKVFEEAGNGEYRDNMPEEAIVDESVDQIVKEIAEAPKKPTRGPEEGKSAAPAKAPAPEDDFAAFEEGFMNPPVLDEELPFR